MTLDLRTLLLPLAAAFLAVNVRVATAAAPATDTLSSAGERILAEKCARCHATGKTGASPLEAAPPFRTLSRKYPLEQLEEALAEGITTGHPEMPEFVFSPDEIAAILSYIESISQPAAGK
jgi:mono/diheme cytochrome c family protein